MQARADSSLHDAWKRRVGSANWDYIRHYCVALHIEGQVPRMRGKRSRDHAWRQMIAEFEQVEKHAQPGFVLMPEILVRKGKAQERLGDPDSAMESYQKAIELNPEYSWSYMAIADLFVATEQPDEARKILEDGLTKVPERFAKGLQRQLTELSQPPLAAEESGQ